ncbi:MAG: alpha-(1-_3)-arabinofuranosyltransferase family protein, partial [Actinomycetes bacterium]
MGRTQAVERESSAPNGSGPGPGRVATRRGDGPLVALLALVVYVPLLVSHWGTLEADTKQYLYLDPGGLLRSAPNLWNSRIDGGSVTHQNIGYLWPMGPFYWVTNVLGVPDWVAQRLWMGSIQFLAALGAYVLFRSLWRDRRAAFVGGLVYGLSPFVLGQITGQSALLLPFCALPWMILATRNALRRDPWLWAAVYALVVTTAGSLNGSSIFFVVVGSLLWVPFAILWERSSSLRTGITTVVKIGLLTAVTQLWWLVAYQVGGRYGLPVLQVTETVRETSSAASAIEALRGLGYWFFYGGDNQGSWLRGLAPPFTQNLALLTVSFVPPLLCLALGWWSRFRERLFFVGLVVAGIVISSVAYGGTSRSLVGGVFEAVSRHSGIVLSLRNSQRAVALTALGLAGLAAAGVTALLRRAPRLATAVGAAVVITVGLTFVAPWSAALLADRYTRAEAVPTAWTDAAHYLDRVDGRALLVPGIDFASYRWGHTLDPVLAGLTRTQVMWRELLPMGGTAGADLLSAFDRSLQNGTFDPRTVVPVAQALGVTHLVVANDLEIERYRIQRPELVMAALSDPATGLRLVRSFNPGYVNVNPGAPITDEKSLRTYATLPTELPQVAIFAVPGIPSGPVSAIATGSETVLAGDGAGFLAAATAGLVPAGGGPVLSAHELTGWPAARRIARSPSTPWIVTDTNRKAQHRYTTLLENDGATQTASGNPVSGVATDITTTDWNGTTTTDQSVVVLRGARSVRANAYSNVVSLLPEDRPTNAFDGDPRTAWRVDLGSFRPLTGGVDHTLTVDLGRAVAADHVDVVQAAPQPGSAPITAFDVVLDGTRTIPATVDPTAAFAPAGTRVALDGRPFTTLEVRIPDDPAVTGEIGIAEVSIPGVAVEELVRLPLTASSNAPSGTPFPLTYVLSRQRADASLVFRADPEPSVRRLLDVPVTMPFALAGTAHLDPRAPDTVLDDALRSLDPGTTATSSGRLLGDPTSRASAALDGNLATWWSSPLAGAVGSTWSMHSDAGFTGPALTLDVVTDDHHSLPTQLDVTVDGVNHAVAVTPLSTSSNPGTTRRVVLDLGGPLSGHDLTVTVRAVDARTGADLSGYPLTLPVAFAEVGVGGPPPAHAVDTVPSACRADLVSVDGTGVPIRLSGHLGTGATGALTVTACGDPLTLTAGTHVVRTADGLDVGLDLDVVSLAAQRVTATGPEPFPGAAPAQALDVRTTGPDAATVVGSGTPYWVRLDRSVNAGWQARADHAGTTRDLGPGHTLDLFANGWLVTRGTSGPTALHFAWTPQRGVDVALAVSALGGLVCLGLLFVRRRRSTARDLPPSPVP